MAYIVMPDVVMERHDSSPACVLRWCLYWHTANITETDYVAMHVDSYCSIFNAYTFIYACYVFSNLRHNLCANGASCNRCRFCVGIWTPDCCDDGWAWQKCAWIDKKKPMPIWIDLVRPDISLDLQIGVVVTGSVQCQRSELLSQRAFPNCCKLYCKLH